MCTASVIELYSQPPEKVRRLNLGIQTKTVLPESRVIGKHFELLFGSGKNDLAELCSLKPRNSPISHINSPYEIFPPNRNTPVLEMTTNSNSN